MLRLSRPLQLALRIRTRWLLGALACLLFLTGRTCADSVGPEYPLVVASRSGREFFKLIPAQGELKGGKYVLKREPFGIAYRLSPQGEFVELWRTKGWYSTALHLAEGGEYLVRLGPWAEDQEKHEDLAVAFYRKGKLLKQYLVRDLLRDQSKAEDSVSHYEWRPFEQTRPTGLDGYGELFHLVTIDKIAYDFAVATGEILKCEEDPKARSFGEVLAARQLGANQKGTALFAATKWKAAFEEHFVVTDMSVVNGQIHGIHFEGSEWMAHLKPLRPLAQPTMVEAVFPITDGSIEVALEPEEIEQALRTALAHPYIAAHLAAGQTEGLRMRITGDRLHWETSKLRELLQQLKHPAAESDFLHSWAYLILDLKSREYSASYLNTATGELIYEDTTQSPYVPYLLNAEGKPVP